LALVPIGRRAFLALSASSLLHGQSGKGAGSTFTPQQFLDPATEFDLFRLTDPQYSAWLPAPHLHFISRRGRFLIYTSDRAGAMQAYRLDWHSGQAKQLTAATALDRATPALSPDDRSLFYFDGPALKQLTMGSLRDRTVTEVPAGWERAPGFSLSRDAATAVWVERQGDRSRVRTLPVAHAEARTVIETPGIIAEVQLRPGFPQVLYRLNGKLRSVHLDGRADQELKTEPDRTLGQALWTPEGQTLLYLSIPAERTQLTTLREISVDQNTDRLVAKTSQFASFGINGDASVFVGASRSLASPYVLLLLRSVRRELTLCEHRSTDAAAVEPVFSPDSQNIFFTSDRRGKRCIYRAHVEKFVEETGGDAPPDTP
jgi:oligogalacturonide lyase